MRGRYWILDGHEPVPVDDVIVWGKFFEQDENRRVALTQLDGAKVSTVFLGRDHSFGRGGPLLFETMIFGGPHADYTDRYATWDEAVAGHQRAVELAANHIEPMTR